jgi:hypothetical protein
LIGISAFVTRSPHLFLYSLRLGRILRERWDLVHCWEEPYVLAGGQIAALTSRETPLVFFTDQNLPKDYPPPFGWIERYCVRRCSGWIGAGASVIERH